MACVVQDIVQDALYNVHTHGVANLSAKLFDWNCGVQFVWIHSLESKHLVNAKFSLQIGYPMAFVPTA